MACVRLLLLLGLLTSTSAAAQIWPDFEPDAEPEDIVEPEGQPEVQPEGPPPPTSDPIAVLGVWPADGSDVPAGSEIWIQTHNTDRFSVVSEADPETVVVVAPTWEGAWRVQLPSDLPQGWMSLALANADHREVLRFNIVDANAVIEGGAPTFSLVDASLVSVTDVAVAHLIYRVDGNSWPTGATAVQLFGVDDTSLQRSASTTAPPDPLVRPELSVDAHSDIDAFVAFTGDDLDVCATLQAQLLNGRYAQGVSRCENVQFDDDEWASAAAVARADMWERRDRRRRVAPDGCQQTPSSLPWWLAGAVLVWGWRRRR